ncbi:MAG TPA: polysulfide reductase NrfD [Casimicrobiaceae bacterium]|nr:polysulfide reductase NrfD [Casimicrobiaceae bacterium]
MRTDYLRQDARRFWGLFFLLAIAVVAGLAAAHYMEENGHIVTGMNNRIVWGLPHVFAIFLIVAASGALNVASIGSVFDRPIYKARAPLSGLLCIAMLAGGLMVLMLDLGRPDRIIVAATHYNLTSVFAWNVFLYSGMFAIVAVYLWMLMERRMRVHAGKVGLAAFIWRIVLTTGTGSIFAFLVARQAYGSAILAPLFIVMSFSWGLAVFLVVQSAMYAWNARALPPEALRVMRNLLGLFIASVLYLTFVQHLTHAYFARQLPFERFILLDGGVYPALFWWGYVVAGSIVPLLLIYHPRFGTPKSVIAASLLVIVGAFAQLYVFIIGGQAWPLEIFPGYQTSSSFGDGQIAAYVPRLPELLLGLGGMAVAFLITVVGVRVLPFLPDDESHAAHVVAAGGHG